MHNSDKTTEFVATTVGVIILAFDPFFAIGIRFFNRRKKVKSAPIVIGQARTTHQCRRLTPVSVV